MAFSRLDIDYTTLKYIRGNQSHQEFITQEINQFNYHFNELCNYDKRTGWLSGLIGLAWFFNSISMMGTLTVNASYFLLSHEFFGRPEYAKHYQDQLNKLLDLYNWCIGDAGDKTITTDKTFLALTGMIMPFVEYEDLKKPFIDFRGVSKEFSDLLFNHPLHQDKFIKDRNKDPVPTSLFSFFVAAKKNDDTLVKSNPENDHSWSSLYNNLYAKIRFDFYSRQSNQSKTLSERCQQIVEPLLTLSRLKK